MPPGKGHILNPCNLLHSSRPVKQFVQNHYNCPTEVTVAKQCNHLSLLVYLGLEERGLNAKRYILNPIIEVAILNGFLITRLQPLSSP